MMFTVSPNNNFSYWLLRRMEELGINQTELAKRVNVSRQTIVNYLSDKVVNHDRETLKRIANALRVTPQEVYRAAGFMPDISEFDKETEELIYLFGKLPRDEQDIVLTMTKAIAERNKKFRAMGE